MTDLGIAIVGRGVMGTAHAQALAALGRAEQIRYVVARTLGATLEAAPRATVVDDLEIVLSDPDVHVVSICTPSGSHRELAVRALAAGKHVLLEKPIALTLEDSRAICDAAERSGTIFMVAHVVRFFEGYRLLARDIAAGKIGAPLSAQAVRAGSRPEWSDWLRNYSQAGGILVDFGIHDIDQLNLLLGDPVEVTATGPVPFGPIETTIRYRSGAVGVVRSFADLPTDEPFHSSIEVRGTAGVARYDFAAGSAEALENAEAAEDPYARQWQYFLDCVAQGVAPEWCPPAAAVAALEVALAATKSLELGIPVRVKPAASV
tara:strand:- start:2050 stop:3006 length:957 start_codon:yes stop_codon:yes gene_type:complete